MRCSCNPSLSWAWWVEEQSLERLQIGSSRVDVEQKAQILSIVRQVRLIKPSVGVEKETRIQTWFPSHCVDQ